MSFSITVLGNSSSMPTSKNFTSAHILNVNEQLFLIDCGEGMQIQLRRFKLKLAKLNHIFITHLHGDHYFGIFGLLSTLDSLKRKKDLHIYAPPELKKILSHKYSPIQIGYVNYKIIFHPHEHTQNKIIYIGKHIIVESFPLIHRIPAWGFIFKEKEKEKNIIKEKITEYNLSIEDILKIKKGSDYINKNNEIIKNNELTTPPKKSYSYAFCSDTIYNEEIIPYIKNVDLLYHEATFAKEEEKQAKLYYHTTTEQAAIIAKKANAKQLIIGHFSARYKNKNKLLAQAQEIFKNTICAEDGLTVKLK